MVLKTDVQALGGSIIGDFLITGDHRRPGIVAIAVLVWHVAAEHADDGGAEKKGEIDGLLAGLHPFSALLAVADEGRAAPDVADGQSVTQAKAFDTAEIFGFLRREGALMEIDAVEVEVVDDADEILNACVLQTEEVAADLDHLGGPFSEITGDGVRLINPPMASNVGCTSSWEDFNREGRPTG